MAMIPIQDERKQLLLQTLAKQLLHPNSIHEQFHQGLQMMDHLRAMIEKSLPLATQAPVQAPPPPVQKTMDPMARALAQLSERLRNNLPIPQKSGFTTPEVERIDTQVKRGTFKKSADTQPILVPAHGKDYDLGRS